MISKLLDKMFVRDPFKKLRKRHGWVRQPVEYVSKDIDKKITEKVGKCKRIKITWNGWWFRSRFNDFKDAFKHHKSYDWQTFKRNCLWSGYYWGSMRGANFLDIYVGPMKVTLRMRYLLGPARVHHREFFKEKVDE